jgi:hypothetical protein
LVMGIARATRNLALNALSEFGVSQADLIDVLETVMPPPVTH